MAVSTTATVAMHKAVAMSAIVTLSVTITVTAVAMMYSDCDCDSEYDGNCDCKCDCDCALETSSPVLTSLLHYFGNTGISFVTNSNQITAIKQVKIFG